MPKQTLNKQGTFTFAKTQENFSQLGSINSATQQAKIFHISFYYVLKTDLSQP
jgi:hypothetical protein